jgi:CheY-like chemotaxis protein
MRCLIVDDSPRFLEAARGLLVREGIVVVAVATNGADAIRRAAELGPDVILVDIDLGGQSGFDVVRRLTREADLAPAGGNFDLHSRRGGLRRADRGEPGGRVPAQDQAVRRRHR